MSHTTSAPLLHEECVYSSGIKLHVLASILTMGKPVKKRNVEAPPSDFTMHPNWAPAQAGSMDSATTKQASAYASKAISMGRILRASFTNTALDTATGIIATGMVVAITLQASACVMATILGMGAHTKNAQAAQLVCSTRILRTKCAQDMASVTPRQVIASATLAIMAPNAKNTRVPTTVVPKGLVISTQGDAYATAATREPHAKSAHAQEAVEALRGHATQAAGSAYVALDSLDLIASQQQRVMWRRLRLKIGPCSVLVGPNARVDG
jgi:hypothetical protein